jgi:hypothetical protein
MARICPVCDKEVGFWSTNVEPGIDIHTSCSHKFNLNPEKYGGKVETIEKTEAQINLEKEHREQQQRIEEKSVHVKSFDMPFGDMVGFMVKWALASIPAFFILAIIGAILVAMFGALFF